MIVWELLNMQWIMRLSGVQIPVLLALGGDSSGGNLALAAAMRAEEFLPEELKVKSLILFYPVVKAYADNSKSWKTYSRGYGLDSRLMEAFNEAYLSSSNVEAAA